MEGTVHKHLKMVACAFLKKMCVDLVAEEIKYKNIKSIADVGAINLKRKEVRIVEVKATLNDFLRDKKLFDIEKSYFRHCNYFYIMCPYGVIPLDKIPKEYGVIYVENASNIPIIMRKPTKNNILKTRFDTSLKNICRATTNCLIFKYHQCQHKIEGFFK